MTVSNRPPRMLTITKDWTLNRLKQECPGVDLILFAHFGVGSRERSGFAGAEVLEDLLRRNLVFDPERACRRLTELAREDRANEVQARALFELMETGSAVVLDARSADDFARNALPGSLHLGAESVAQVCQAKPKRVVVLCNDGSQAPSGSRFLRTRGLSASHLVGGLTAWSIEVDQTVPILFPLSEHEGCWHLLADSQTLRYRSDAAVGAPECRLWSREKLGARPEFASLLESTPELTLLVASSGSLSFRGLPQCLTKVASLLKGFLPHHQTLLSGGEATDIWSECQRIDRVLAEEAPSVLKSHKGTVEVEDYERRVLTLRLGGGCAGCASAAITTQRELAALLYQAVPTIDRIRNSDLD